MLPLYDSTGLDDDDENDITDELTDDFLLTISYDRTPSRRLLRCTPH